jgi:hypothetical protein
MRGRVRVDVLVAPGGLASFELVEVKLAGRVRVYHETDVAFSSPVGGGGLEVVRRASCSSIDLRAPGRRSRIPRRLFTTVDLTEKRCAGPVVRQRLAAMWQVVARDDAPAGSHGDPMSTPYRCPSSVIVTSAGRHPGHGPPPALGRAAGAARRARDRRRPRRCPADLPGAHPLQLRRAGRGAGRDGAVAGARRGSTLLAAIPLARALRRLRDLRAGRAGLPRYAPVRAGAVPVVESRASRPTGTITHREFLHDADADPRRRFAESLLAATADAAALVVYSSFEGERAGGARRAAPASRGRGCSIGARASSTAADRARPLRTPALRGSFSIKSVLPAFVPRLGLRRPRHPRRPARRRSRTRSGRSRDSTRAARRAARASSCVLPARHRGDGGALPRARRAVAADATI